MSIQRFEPFRELMNIQERMNRLFGDLGAQSQAADGELATATWSPAVDIYETPQEIVMLADLPDLKQEDIQVSVDRDRLLLRGERALPADIKRESYHRIERAYGAFARVFTLPPNVDLERIRADYSRSGVLKITLPKRETGHVRQIAVDVE